MNELLKFINDSQRLYEDDAFYIWFEKTDLRTIQRFSSKNYIKVVEIDYNNRIYRYKLIDKGVYIHAFNVL